MIYITNIYYIYMVMCIYITYVQIYSYSPLAVLRGRFSFCFMSLYMQICFYFNFKTSVLKDFY